MLDIGLIAAAKKAVASKPRHFVTPAILLAFVEQESHCANIFVDTKPGSQYALNVADAIVHKRRDKTGKLIGKIPTGLRESEIRQYVTLPNEIDGWQVPKEFAGQKAKFRFEFGFWHAGPEPKEQRFRMACSWGLVQFMSFNIVGKLTGEAADKAILRFACDVPLQLLEGAGAIDQLLIEAHGDVLRAYKGYNSGKIDSQDPAVIARAKAVAAYAIQYDTYLKGTNNV